MQHRIPGIFLLLLASTAPPVNAQDVYVPEELEPWRQWVLDGKEYRACPFFYDRNAAAETDFICAWPGRLQIDVDDSGGRFRQGWTVHATNQWVPLPGNLEHWPQSVTADGDAASVVARNGVPHIRLAPGNHTIAGRFGWAERPRSFAVPSQSGLLDLSIDGEPVLRAERDGGTVWLGEREQERRVEDSMRVEVYRLVADDIPTTLATLYRIEVSGSVREELIGPAMPDGFTPMTLDGDLPVRLEPGGNLRVQVRPGSWEILLGARAAGVLDALSMPAPQQNLPPAEIWSYRSNDELRVTVAEDLAPVDPLQADVPADWEELPAYRAEPGDTMRIVERSRGRVATENLLDLYRQLWLDFDGGGFVYADHLHGTMRSGWRLDMRMPFALLNAVQDDENLLVTAGDGDGLSGIEVRQPALDVQTLGRTETRGSLPVTGWQASFTNVDTTLYLPPGNKLLVASGADPGSTSWVDQWHLLDFFLVLVTAIAAARLFGRAAGVLALLALVLSLHEPGAPGFIWLNALVAVALVRVAPAGRLDRASRAYRMLSFVVLVALFVPFAANQLRIAIYPQLEPQGYGPGPVPYGARDPAMSKVAVDADRAAMQSRAPASVSPEAPAARLEEIVVTAARVAPGFSRYAPNAIVQVGPGRPAWQWNTYRLHWSGPVEPEHTTRLVVLPRGIVTALRFLEVALLGALVAVFACEILDRPMPWLRGRPAAANSAALLLLGLLAAAGLSVPEVARADTPSDSLLRQLEERLLEPPPCVPRCAEVLEAEVELTGDAMTIRLDAAALADVALELPGSLQGWRPVRIVIDGRPAAEAYRSADRSLWVRMAEGRHAITLDGPLPQVDSLEVPFPAPPRVIRVNAADWFVAGIDDRRLTSGSLQLTRLRSEESGAGAAARWESTRFPVFVRVERTIDMDLDWRARTIVHREAPAQGAINISIPLLPGESVTTDGVTVIDGQAVVSMEPAQDSMSWQSTIVQQTPLVFAAGSEVPWRERWDFAIGNIWHAGFEGIPESETGDTGAGYRVARFHPRAGESLRVDVTRPEATSGDTMVFDVIRLTTDVGARSRAADMTLGYRSTRGQQHTIRLPEDAEVTSVSIDGAVSPIRAEGGVLQLPILPGQHEISVAWREDRPIGFRTRVPAVGLAAGASNAHLRLEMPPNRWILGTFGPALGPGVLYWSELVVLLIAAGILARFRGVTPLGARQWLLLGLGFSTFSWTALAIVAGWLLVVGGHRGVKAKLDGMRYNLLQAGVGALTVVALVTIVGSLPQGLLGSPDMHVTGNGSYGNTLNWFGDRSMGAIPQAFVLSVPMWIYQLLILAWSLWLSFALIRWLPWAWREFVADGLWKPRQPQAT